MIDGAAVGRSFAFHGAYYRSHDTTYGKVSILTQRGVESVDRSAQVERGHGRTVGQIASVLSAKGIVDPAD